MLRRLFERLFGGSPRRLPDPEALPPPPPRYGVADLVRVLGLDETTLREFRPGYRTFDIPKRSGGRRRIDAPDEATLRLQRLLLQRVLTRPRAHPAATGFERGHSIVTNAMPHLRQAVVLRLDLRDFFPSTGTDRVRERLRLFGWDEDGAALLTRLTTHGKGLPQGAPTSPRLANLVNFGLDARLEGLARHYEGVYTRYADDLTFSFEVDRPGRLGNTINAVKSICSEYGYRLHTKKKIRIARRHQRQLVTGIVVNERPNLPRAIRRRLRAVEHRLRTGREATLTPEQLAGWRALLSMVRTQGDRFGERSR